MPLSMPAAKIAVLVTNRSSPTSWVRRPRRSVRMPSRPVVLGHAVLDADDRVVAHQGGEAGRRSRRAEHLAFAGEVVVAVAVELRGGAVERQADLAAGLVAGLLDRLEDQLERLAGAGRLGRSRPRRRPRSAGPACRAARAAHGRSRPGAQRLAKALEAARHDHAFLDVEAVVGVRAAVDDVHQRGRQDQAARAGRQVAVQRQAGRARAGVGGGERDREQRVGAERGFVVAAVELDEAHRSPPARAHRRRPAPPRSALRCWPAP